MSVNEIYKLSCRKRAQIFVAPLNTKYMVYLHESHNAILASSEVGSTGRVYQPLLSHEVASGHYDTVNVLFQLVMEKGERNLPRGACSWYETCNGL